MSRKPVVHWTMDNISTGLGTTIHDEMGGYDISGGMGYDWTQTTGKFDYGLTGSDPLSVMTINGSPALFAVSMWIKRKDTDKFTVFLVSDSVAFGIAPDSDGNTVGIWDIDQDDTTDGGTLGDQTNLTIDDTTTWHHICLVPTSQAATSHLIYVDGVAASSALTWAGGDVSYISADWTLSGFSAFESADLDNVQLYGVLLTGAEVTSLYSATSQMFYVTMKTPINWWTMDDVTSDYGQHIIHNEIEDSGGSLDTELDWALSAGKFSNGLIPSTATLRPVYCYDKSFTSLSIWLKRYDDAEESRFAINLDGDGWMIADDGEIGCEVDSTFVGSGLSITDDTTWHHVAIVADSTSPGDFWVYLDGTKATASIAGLSDIYYLSSDQTVNLANGCAIDNAQMYESALSDTDVEDLADAVDQDFTIGQDSDGVVDVNFVPNLAEVYGVAFQPEYYTASYNAPVAEVTSYTASSIVVTGNFEAPLVEVVSTPVTILEGRLTPRMPVVVGNGVIENIFTGQYASPWIQVVCDFALNAEFTAPLPQVNSVVLVDAIINSNIDAPMVNYHGNYGNHGLFIASVSQLQSSLLVDATVAGGVEVPVPAVRADFGSDTVFVSPLIQVGATVGADLLISVSLETPRADFSGTTGYDVVFAASAPTVTAVLDNPAWITGQFVTSGAVLQGTIYRWPVGWGSIQSPRVAVNSVLTTDNAFTVTLQTSHPRINSTAYDWLSGNGNIITPMVRITSFMSTDDCCAVSTTNQIIRYNRYGRCSAGA